MSTRRLYLLYIEIEFMTPDSSPRGRLRYPSGRLEIHEFQNILQTDLNLLFLRTSPEEEELPRAQAIGSALVPCFLFFC